MVDGNAAAAEAGGLAELFGWSDVKGNRLLKAGLPRQAGGVLR